MGAGGNTSTEYYAKDNTFSHNTLYGCGNGMKFVTLGDYVGAIVENNTMVNNIIFDTKEHYVSLNISRLNIFNNNLYYDSDGNYSFKDNSIEINSFEEYQNQTGYDLLSVVVDPLLQNVEIYDEVEFFANRGNYFSPNLDGPVCSSGNDGSYVGAIPCHSPSNDDPSSDGPGSSSSSSNNENGNDSSSQNVEGNEEVPGNLFYNAVYFVQSYAPAIVIILAIIITIVIGANRIYFKIKRKKIKA